MDGRLSWRKFCSQSECLVWENWTSVIDDWEPCLQKLWNWSAAQTAVNPLFAVTEILCTWQRQRSPRILVNSIARRVETCAANGVASGGPLTDTTSPQSRRVSRTARIFSSFRRTRSQTMKSSTLTGLNKQNLFSTRSDLLNCLDMNNCSSAIRREEIE